MSARLSIPTTRPSCRTGSWCRPLSAMRPIATLSSVSGVTVFRGTDVMIIRHRCGRPCILRQLLGVAERDDPDEPSVVHDRQRAVAALQHLLEHEVLHTQRGSCDCRRLVHQTADQHSVQGLALRLLVARRFRRSCSGTNR